MKDPTRPALPTVFKGLCIAGLVLGIYSFCCYVTSGATLAFQGVQERMIEQMRRDHPNDPMLRGQEEVMREARRVQEKWRIANIVMVPTAVLANLGLIVAAALSLQRKRLGPPILVGACYVHIVIDVVASVIGALSQRDSQRIVQASMRNASRNMPFSMETFMEGITAFAMVLTFMWIALKIAYCVATIIQARKPELRHYMTN